MSDGFLRAMEERARDTTPSSLATVEGVVASFDNLPTDVLAALVPYLLVGRVDTRTASWSFPSSQRIHPRGGLVACPPPIVRIAALLSWWSQGGLPSQHTTETALLPPLRAMMICQKMSQAVNTHMARLLVPREQTVPAVVKIEEFWWTYRTESDDDDPYLTDEFY
jgi:hypothetical protein